jgi:prepilin-type N-terminal cleavage/methylation domain-containing protein
MKRGFTLIELLIVVAIIGVMMAGALLNLGSGRDIARLREASRGVAQMAHYANALALLRQRPVVLSYTQKTGEGGRPIVCIDVKISGETMAVAGGGQPAEPIYREVDGQDTSAAGVQAAMDDAAEDGAGGGKSVAERTGVFFTRQILDPDELAKEDASREFEGLSLELELLGEDGAVVDERTAALLKDQAEGILNNRKAAITAWSNTRGEIDTGKTEDEKDGAGSLSDKSPDHVIFETNGNCQPHRVVLRMEGEDAKSDGLTITVTRSGKVIIGDPEDK